MGRLEEAVAFYRQAVDIHVEMGDLHKEGIVRSNLANVLQQLLNATMRPVQRS